MKKILYEDYDILVSRIQQLQKQLFDLGEDFHEAVNQSSETWHDNAPFDAVRDKQSILQHELSGLKLIRTTSTRFRPKKSALVSIGSKVELKGNKNISLLIGGHWIGRNIHEGYTVISCESQVAMALLNHKVGDHITLGSRDYTVSQIA